MRTFIPPVSPETEPGSLFATVCLFALPIMALTTSFGMTLLQLVMLISSLFLMRNGLPGWYRRHWHELRYLIFAFAGFFIVSLVRTLLNHRGLASLDGPLRMILALSYIGFVAWLRPQIRYFWLGMCLGTIGACLIALVQRFVIGMERAVGYTNLSITFGDLSMAMGLMSLCMFAGWPGEWRKLTFLPLLALICGLVATVLSGTRGAWIAIPLVATLLFTNRVRMGRVVIYASVLTMSIMIMAYNIPATGVAHRFWEAVSDVQGGKPDTVTTGGVRLELWKASWLMFTEHPMLGVGRDQFHPALQQLVAQGRLQQTPTLPYALNYSSSHNDALHFLATGGLLDFSFLLLLYGAPLAFFLRILRGRQAEYQAPALAGMVLVLCFIGFGLTDVMFWSMAPKVFYVVMVSVLTGFCLPGRQYE